MDFLDPKKRKSHNVRLFIGYILVAIAIALATWLLLNLSFGYNLDRKTGLVVQNGLVFVSSQPVPADIFINGVQHNARSNTRLDLIEGQYEIELKADGYRSWKKKFNLAGGTIERLVYPFLIPENLTSKDEQLYGKLPLFATQSPDRQWLLVQQPGTNVNFDLINLNDPNVPIKTLTVPASLLTDGKKQSWSLPEWSTDNRRVLLRHNYADGFEYIVFDREAVNSSVNLNKTFGVNPPEVTLRDKKFDQYYFYDPATEILQNADLKTNELTTELKDVLAFKSHGNELLLYVTTDGAPKDKARVMIREAGESYHVRDFALKTKYLLDITRFNGLWYMVAGAESEDKVYVYKDAVALIKQDAQKLPVPVGILKVDDPQFVAFSANARFIMAQDGPNFAIYDAETDRHYMYKIDATIAATQKAAWMDGHRLSVTNKGKTLIFDFDGINLQTLGASAEGFQPYFDRDYTAVYNVGPSVTVPNRSALTHTPLVSTSK